MKKIILACIGSFIIGLLFRTEITISWKHDPLPPKTKFTTNYFDGAGNPSHPNYMAGDSVFMHIPPPANYPDNDWTARMKQLSLCTNTQGEWAFKWNRIGNRLRFSTRDEAIKAALQWDEDIKQRGDMEGQRGFTKAQ